MMYDARILIEELFKRNFKNKKKTFVNYPPTVKPLDKIDTNYTIRDNTSRKLFITNKELSKKRKTKMLFNDVIYNSTRHFFKENATPIEKRILSRYQTQNDNYKQFIIQKQKMSMFLNFERKVPKKETPYEMNKNKKHFYQSMLEAKIIMNTTSNLTTHEMITSYQSKPKSVKKFRLSSSTPRYIKPSLYFNNLNLKKYETKHKKIF